MPTTPAPTPNTHRHLEIIAVLVTALGKFIFMDWLEWKLPFISIAIIAWVVYVNIPDSFDPPFR